MAQEVELKADNQRIKSLKHNMEKILFQKIQVEIFKLQDLEA
jgi:hypothetical protein